MTNHSLDFDSQMTEPRPLSHGFTELMTSYWNNVHCNQQISWLVNGGSVGDYPGYVGAHRVSDDPCDWCPKPMSEHSFGFVAAETTHIDGRQGGVYTLVDCGPQGLGVAGVTRP